MRIKNIYIILVFLLMLPFLSACQATLSTENDMKNKSETIIEDREDVIAALEVQEVEAEEKVDSSSPDTDTDDSALQLSYSDFQGTYAYYEGEPYHSQIAETLLLEEDYIDWAGLEADVQTYDIQDDSLTLTVIQQVQDSSSDQVFSTNVYHLTYSLDYRSSHRVLTDLNGKVYHELSDEEGGS